MYVIAVYEMLLHILHTFYTIVQIILDICTNIVQLVKNLYIDNDIERLRLEVNSLEKKPNHVVIILGNEEPSFKDLAKLVKWCSVVEISFITFYDHNGILKITQNQLFEAINNVNIKYKNGAQLNAAPSHKNGIKTPICVNIISYADGREKVAEFIKDCAINGVKIDEIEQDYVDENIKRLFGQAPDPDLALYCGKVCSTYGVLPWQIRSTEFVDIVSHHGININAFKRALKIYGYCEQRFGK